MVRAVEPQVDRAHVADLREHVIVELAVCLGTVDVHNDEALACHSWCVVRHDDTYLSALRGFLITFELEAPARSGFNSG